LEKRLPVGGGLGGGSSDAASVLIGLNRLWDTGLARGELAVLSLQLGADLPFFIVGENALVRGIGEEILPVTVPPAWYVVVDPGVVCSTGEVFADPNLTRNGESAKIALFSDAYGKNDLQPVATRLHPQIEGGLAWLSAFGEPRMTGSGACVFAVFATEREARAAWVRRPSGTRGFVAPGLPRHPLRDWVED
jgi:4-diphosphocytidyl-2-C-methyl-D-erythritol kinase